MNTTAQQIAEDMIADLRKSKEQYDRRTAAKFHESECFAQAAVDSLSAQIAILDETGTIITVNRAWLRFAQANSASLPTVSEGVNYLAVCDAASGPGSELSKEFAAGIRMIMQGAQDEFTLEYPCHSPSEKRWFIGRVTRFHEGDALRLVIAHENITERKLLEEETAKVEEQDRQLEKAESLGRMSGAVAHHFNNQLQAVTGYLEMVIADLPKSDSSAIKLTRALQAARKASDLSTLLLAYLGHIPVKSEMLDVSELCRMSLPVLRAGMTECVTLEIDLPSPGPLIMADPKQIKLLLSNLITNAAEAIDGNPGTIRLNVRTVSGKDIPASNRFPVDWRLQEHSYACIEITDSGCGIGEDDMGRIFNPFFSTKFIGRGLGLPVVLGIVRAHAAVVTVKSRTGGRSVFSVFFPISTRTA